MPPPNPRITNQKGYHGQSFKKFKPTKLPIFIIEANMIDRKPPILSNKEPPSKFPITLPNALIINTTPAVLKLLFNSSFIYIVFKGHKKLRSEERRVGKE